MSVRFNNYILILVCFALVFLAVDAFGQERVAEKPTAEVVTELHWQFPGTRVNGTPLTVDEIARYEIEVKSNTGRDEILAVEREQTAAVPLQTTDRHDYPVTGEALVVEYRIRTVTVDAEDNVSAWSEPAVYTATLVINSPPTPPIQLRLGVSCEDCSLIERE